MPLQQIDPRFLVPHPLNPQIYGEDEDVTELINAISKSNWIKDIVVTANNQIISGHRRVKAAIALGWNTVPVVVRSFNTPLEELEALLLENQYREKSIEQRVREGRLWEEIERAYAKQRQIELAGTRPNTRDLEAQTQLDDLVVNSPQGQKGKTRDLVAEKVGLKGWNYQRASKVVEAIDLQDRETANKLRSLLNDKSVNAAYKELNVLKQKQSQLKLDELKHSIDRRASLLFPFRVGEVCQIVPKKNSDLKKYSSCWAVIVEVYEFSCRVRVWDNEELRIMEENLKSFEYTQEQQHQFQKLSERIFRLKTSAQMEPMIHLNLEFLGKLNRPYLTPFELKMLSFIEQEAFLDEED